MEAASMETIKVFAVPALAAMLSGCGVGCLYVESGKVVSVRVDSLPSPENVVQAVGDALRPMGFTGQPIAPAITQRGSLPDYGFSVGVYKFAPRERADISIKYDDLSISLADFARGSTASAFDRSVMTAIQTRLRSELNADITFTHLPAPAFCLGP
jgi:hypothetical protein